MASPPASPHRHNLHGVGLVLDRHGVLICGSSGAGKTTLALALIGHAHAQGIGAFLVADDQLWLRPSARRLVLEAPGPIAGMAEAYGFGPGHLPHLPALVVDLVVDLVPEAEAPRFAGEATKAVAGFDLPVLRLAARNHVSAVSAICARLDLPPFAGSGH